MSLPPHLHHSYLCPPPPPLPLLTLFDLWGSLVSGPAGLLLGVNAEAEVGGAGGGGAGVIPEGPGKSQEVKCAPVNGHVGREGEGCVSVMKTKRRNSFHLLHTAVHTPILFAPHARKSHALMRIR